MAWQIDPSHSQLEFKVRHMMLSNVRGRFENFTGTVEFDENNPLDFSVDVEVDATSIYTRESQRDAHLKSPDFLMTEQYPTLKFRSTGVEKTGEKTFRLNGENVTGKRYFASTAGNFVAKSLPPVVKFSITAQYSIRYACRSAMPPRKNRPRYKNGMK